MIKAIGFVLGTVFAYTAWKLATADGRSVVPTDATKAAPKTAAGTPVSGHTG